MTLRLPPVLYALVLAVVGCNVEAGARCLMTGEAQCDGPARMLLCNEHRWTAIACGGPAGCAANGRFVDCDESRAVVGTPCGNDASGHGSCSTDGSQLLECTAGTWQTIATCRGPDACKVSEDRRFADCDDSVAAVDDACVGADQLACSIDGHEILRCTTGRFVRDETCARGPCVATDDLIECTPTPDDEP